MVPHRVAVPVETRAPTGETNAYCTAGPDALLVDPARQTDALDAAVASADIGHVAVTHHHPDHVGAVSHYARETDATVWARRGRTEAFEAATGVAPDRTFVEGTTIPADDAVEHGSTSNRLTADNGVTVIDLPGHAPEHVGFLTDSGIISGDFAVAEGSVVVGAPEGDMRAYLTALRRLHARNPEALLPGHGPTIESPRAVCRRLLSHRLNRERRIRAAVDAGCRTPDEIVDHAYAKDLAGVRDLAIATAVAHLEKLAVEGRVRWDGAAARFPEN